MPLLAILFALLITGAFGLSFAWVLTWVVPILVENPSHFWGWVAVIMILWSTVTLASPNKD